MMKKVIMMVCAALATAAVFAQQITLEQARAKIAEAIANPKVMTSLVKQLSAEDQKKFLAEVNVAIGELPGSADAVSQTYVEVNRAALMGAKETGTVVEMVAEVFATVPVANLPKVTENFATDLFNRASDPSKTYTDAQYEAIAKQIMKTAADRNTSADNTSVRDGFVAAMLMQGSNGAPGEPSTESLAGALVAFFPEDSQKQAKDEWLADGAKNYDAMLGAAEVPAEGQGKGPANTVFANATSGLNLKSPSSQPYESLLGYIVNNVELIIMNEHNVDGSAGVPMREVNSNTDTPTEPIGYDGQTL